MIYTCKREDDDGRCAILVHPSSDADEPLSWLLSAGLVYVLSRSRGAPASTTPGSPAHEALQTGPPFREGLQVSRRNRQGNSSFQPEVAYERLLALSPMDDFATMTPKGDMRIQTPRDIGLIMRQQRKHLRWDQRALAERVGVSRQWVVDAEKGRAGTEIGLVLRALNALGLDVDLTASGAPQRQQDALQPNDVDEVVSRAKEPRRG